MRRKDREMNREFALGIIDQADYGVVSMNDNPKPYSIPLSIVRDGDMLYFHSSKQGKKVELLKDGDLISVVFVGRVEVPENFIKDQLEAMAKDEKKAVEFISKVFTTEFESVIVLGTIYEVEEENERIHAMRLICEKYTHTKMHLFNLAISAGMARTAVYRIEIASITGKRKQFDVQGNEMKWGRME